MSRETGIDFVGVYTYHVVDDGQLAPSGPREAVEDQAHYMFWIYKIEQKVTIHVITPSIHYEQHFKSLMQLTSMSYVCLLAGTRMECFIALQEYAKRISKGLKTTYS